jgi:hypothetical protein
MSGNKERQICQYPSSLTLVDSFIGISENLDPRDQISVVNNFRYDGLMNQSRAIESVTSIISL